MPDQSTSSSSVSPQLQPQEVSIAPGSIPRGIAGWWRHEDNDTPVQLHLALSEAGDRLSVRVLETDSNEEMRVENITFNSGMLSFETVLPSTLYRAAHRWTFKDSSLAQVALTVFETWVREDAPAEELLST